VLPVVHSYALVESLCNSALVAINDALGEADTVFTVVPDSIGDWLEQAAPFMGTTL